MKKKYIKIICLITLILCCVFLVACNGIKKPLNKNKIAEVVPEEILAYSLNNKHEVMSIKDVSIERRQTNNKEDIVYLAIDMESSDLHRTAYYIFTINYYDTGGWILDNWETYQDTVAYPLKAPPIEAANKVMDEYFTNYNYDKTNTDNIRDGSCTITFDVNDTRPNLTYSGKADVIFRLYQPQPERFLWNTSINRSEIISKWNIIGEWSAIHDGYGYNYLSMNITEVTDNTIKVNGVYGYSSNSYSQSAENCDFNEAFPFQSNSSTISFTLYDQWGWSYWSININVDSATAYYKSASRVDALVRGPFHSPLMFDNSAISDNRTFVIDDADVLSERTTEDIISANLDLERRCFGAQIVVVTKNNLNGQYSDEYAYALFNTLGVGTAGTNNGMLLLLVTEEKKGWLVIGGGISGVFSSKMADDYLNTYFWPDVDAGNYDTAVRSILGQLFSWYADYYKT